jgi:hypothetical protein
VLACAADPMSSSRAAAIKPFLILTKYMTSPFSSR